MQVKIDIADNVATWTIDSPSRGNGIGPTLARELLGCLEDLKTRLASDPQVIRVLVLRAEVIERPHRRLWLCGGDLKELSQVEDATAYVRDVESFLRGIEDLSIPVVAAVDGACIGGGVEMICACDIRIATLQSEFHFKQVTNGLATGYGSIQRLVRAMGVDRPRKALLLGESLDAQTALKSGLVHELAKDGQELQSRLDGVIATLACQDASALSAQKKMFANALRSSSELADTELQLFTSLWRKPAHLDFLKKFADRSK